MHACSNRTFKIKKLTCLQVDVVITTPLRLTRLVRKKRIALDTVQHLVVDEADKLLELNQNPHTVSHLHQINKILESCTSPNLVSTLCPCMNV